MSNAEPTTVSDEEAQKQYHEAMAKAEKLAKHVFDRFMRKVEDQDHFMVAVYGSAILQAHLKAINNNFIFNVLKSASDEQKAILAEDCEKITEDHYQWILKHTKPESEES